MKIVRLSTARRAVKLAKDAIPRGRRNEDAELSSHRRDIRKYIRALERTALSPKATVDERATAVKSLAAMVLVAYVTEQDCKRLAV